MNRIRTWAQRGTALAAAVVLVASCGAGGREEAEESTEGSTVGITDTSVKIGAHYPLTGVAAPGYSEIPTGAKAYFDYWISRMVVCDSRSARSKSRKTCRGSSPSTTTGDHPCPDR